MTSNIQVVDTLAFHFNSVISEDNFLAGNKLDVLICCV